MRGVEARPSMASKQQHHHHHQQHAQANIRPNSASDIADDPATTNTAGWPSSMYVMGSASCGMGLGVSCPCSASRLTGKRADSYMSKRELSSCTQGDTQGSREGKNIRPPAPTDDGLASKCCKLSSQGCEWMERDVLAGFLQRKESAAAALSHHAGQSNPCCKVTVRSSGDRLEVSPVGDSTSPAIALNDVHTLGSCRCVGHSQCTADERKKCGGQCRNVAPAAPTAPATPAGASEAVTTADIPEALGVHRSRAVSRAAVEAWAAAEKWASTLAVATDAVTSRGRRLGVETDSIADVHLEALGGMESGRQHCDVDVKGLDKDGCRCFLSGNCVNGGVGQRFSHWRSRVHNDSSLRGEAVRTVGGCHPVGGSSSRLPQDAPSSVSSRSLFGGRRKYNPFGGGKRRPVGTGVSGSMNLQGAAAAIVLWRIDRGEQSWRRQAKRAGLEAFRARCLQAGRRKQRDAMAKAHWERAGTVRGFRAMEALLKRKGQHGKAEATVAAADVLTRARRMRRVLVMLKRNWQVCVALRSRDDVADLHFAECRLPDTTRTWREKARKGRSFHIASILANRERRSKSIRAALTQWANHSLGDREKRRKLLAWRDALSTHHRRVEDDFDSTLAVGMGRNYVSQPPDTQARDIFGMGRAQGTKDLLARTLSMPVPAKSQLRRPSLSTTEEVTVTVLADRRRENERGATTACTGRTDLRDGRDAQEHATRDSERLRVDADMDHKEMTFAVRDSVLAPSKARQPLVRQPRADFGGQCPEATMTAHSTREARAVGAGEDELEEDRERKKNRSNKDSASSGGLGLGDTCDASQCTTQGDGSSLRAGETLEEGGRSQDVASRLALEAVGANMNETSTSDVSRGGLSHDSTQPRTAVTEDNAAVVLSGSVGSVDGVGGFGGNAQSRTEQGGVRDIPIVVVNSGRVGDSQGAAADIVEKKPVATSTTVRSDVGTRPVIDGELDKQEEGVDDVEARPVIDGELDKLEEGVDYQRIVREESLRRPSIVFRTGTLKDGDISACTSMRVCHSSNVETGALRVPGAEELTVSACDEPEAIEKGISLPQLGQEGKGLLSHSARAGETICETDDLFRQCSMLLYEATVVSGGAVSTSESRHGVRSLSHSQEDDESKGEAPSTVTSVTCSSVSLSRPLSRVTSTGQSQTRGITSAPNSSCVNNKSRAECTAGPCARSDGSDSVELSAPGPGGDKDRQCTTKGAVESKNDTRADRRGVLSLSREMALRAEDLRHSEEKKSSRSRHGSELSVAARAVFICSEGTPSEAKTYAGSDTCYVGTGSAREGEAEVEIHAKLCVKDDNGCGIPSVPDLAPRDLEVFPLVTSSADVRDAHSCRRPRSREECVENRLLENNKKGTPDYRSSTDEDEREVFPTYAGREVSPSPLPLCRDGHSDASSGVENTTAGGVLGSLGPPIAYANRLERNSTGEKWSSSSRERNRHRASTKSVAVEVTETTGTMSQREQPGDLQSLSMKQGRHSQFEGSQPASSPPSSPENLVAVLANREEGVVTESATHPKLAASGRGIPQDELPAQHPAKIALSSPGDEKGVRRNKQGGVLLADPGSGRALSSELSSISWSDHCEGSVQNQAKSLESTEDRTAKWELAGNCLGFALKHSTLDEPVSRDLPRAVPAQVDCVVVARQPIGLQSSLGEKEELVDSKVADFLPQTDQHVTAPAQQTSIGELSTGFEAQLEYQPPHQVEPTCVFGNIDVEESQADSSHTDRSVRKRADGFERRSQQRLSMSERPQRASRSSHGCADNKVSADLRLAARSQQESGSDDIVEETTRVCSRVLDTIETTMKKNGVRSSAGDSVALSVPEVLSSAESVESFGDVDGNGASLTSCDLQTRVGLEGDGTHPRVTDDRQSGRNGAAECGGLLRNRSAALATRPRSNRGTGPSVDCEPEVASPSPKLAPPDVVSLSSRGTEGTTYSAKYVRKSSILSAGRASIREVGGLQISVQDGLQEPPPLRKSLSTCSVRGEGDPSRVPEGDIGSRSVDRGIGDGGSKGTTTSGGGKRSDKVTLSSRSTASSRSSHRRRGTLEERMSEAFLIRRLQAIGLRSWCLHLVTSTARRRSAYSLAVCASTFAKRVALTKWRSANAALLAVKAAAKVRRFEQIALLGLGPRLTATMDNTAVAIVTFRRWHQRSAAKALLRRAFCAWASRTRLSRSVEAFRCRVLAKDGLLVWRRAAQRADQSRVRSRAIAKFMLRAAGKRRFRAWRQRRRRQADALGVAEEYRAGTGNKLAARRWHRSERLRARCALRVWLATVQERPVMRAAHLAALAGVENRQKLIATRAWRTLAGEMRRRRCVRRKGDVQHARHLSIQGLRGVRGGTLHARTQRNALEVGDAHWKRRGATLIIETLRNLLDSRMRAFHRAESLRLRAIARASLNSWRCIVRSRRVAQNALEKAYGWRQKRTGKTIFLTFTTNVDLKVAQDRGMRVGQRHLRERQISSAVTLWRVWTRRQAAGAELYAAAGALHKSWAVSTGLRALDRVARARTARWNASHIAERYLLRTSGLERWRAATAARKYAQGQARIATLYWARNLSLKVWISWQVATVQQWARSRQVEAAAQHERRRCKKRALRAWAASVFRSTGARNGRRERGRPLSSAFTSDRGNCCRDGSLFVSGS